MTNENNTKEESFLAGEEIKINKAVIEKKSLELNEINSFLEEIENSNMITKTEVLKNINRVRGNIEHKIFVMKLEISRWEERTEYLSKLLGSKKMNLLKMKKVLNFVKEYRGKYIPAIRSINLFPERGTAIVVTEERNYNFTYKFFTKEEAEPESFCFKEKTN